jgi:hypothetical protein
VDVYVGMKIDGVTNHLVKEWENVHDNVLLGFPSVCRRVRPLSFQCLRCLVCEVDCFHCIGYAVGRRLRNYARSM